jgi:hypothetical protein
MRRIKLITCLIMNRRGWQTYLFANSSGRYSDESDRHIHCAVFTARVIKRAMSYTTCELEVTHNPNAIWQLSNSKR